MTIEEKKQTSCADSEPHDCAKKTLFLKWKSVCVKTTASALVRKQNPLMYSARP